MIEKNKYIDQIWKCLPIYEQYGQESYEIYLSKTIGRMRLEPLDDVELQVLKELEALYTIGDILNHSTLKSIVLSCTNMLDNDKWGG
jgi:uncharacterized protein YjfI (DUF2170 family)